MTREKAIRLKIYELLNGNVSYESSPVPVHDAVLQDDENNSYILLTLQRASNKSNFHQDTWDCEQDIEIYSKQMQSVSKDVVDDIAEQVETLIYQSLRSGVNYNGWQINNVMLSTTENNAFMLSETKSIVSKFMTFRLTATKISSY